MEKIEYYFDQPVDIELISDTFLSAFKVPLDVKTWEWRFLTNPVTNKVYINYIIINNVLAAYYAVSPVTILVDEKPQKIALSNMTMTHPEHQGKGYFKTLALDMYAKLKDDGYLGVFGFANQNSHYGFRKNLGWNDLTGLNNFSVNNNTFRTDLLKKDIQLTCEIAPVSLVDLKLASKLSYTNRNIKPGRDEDFLAWRLLNNPSNDYYVLKVVSNNELKGLLFFKFYSGSIDVMEWFCNENYSTNTSIVLVNALSYLMEKYNMQINIWTNLYSEEHLLLEKFGFKEGSFLTYFGVIPFTPNSLLTNIKDWHYRFLDSDVF